MWTCVLMCGPCQNSVSMGVDIDVGAWALLRFCEHGCGRGFDVWAWLGFSQRGPD